MPNSPPPQPSAPPVENQTGAYGKAVGAPRWSRLRQGATVAVAVVLVLLMLEALARILITASRPATGSNKNFDSKYAIAEHIRTDRPRLLCVGDSLITRAIYSEYLSAKLAEAGVDADVINLASSSSWPLEQLFLLERATEHGQKPLAVIYDVAPLPLKVGKRLLAGYSEDFQSSALGNRLAASQGQSGPVEQFLTRNFYLYSYRTFLGKVFGQVFDRISDPEGFLTRYPLDRTYGETSPRGWAPAYHVSTADELEKIAKEPKPWRRFPKVIASDLPSPEVYTAGPIRKFCADRGIPLIFVWLPVHPYCGDMTQSSFGISMEECRKVFNTVAKTPGTWFVDLHDTDHDPRHYLDVSHVNAVGSVIATERIAEALCKPPLRALLERKDDKR